jgi:signal transduction histidine kinase
MSPGGARDEVRALAESFDTMLDRLEDAFARQRAFASDASHELRTPLTVIRGQLEVLARNRDPSAEDVRHVERLVRTEIVRMERLVEDLLVLARADEAEFLRPRTLDLVPFCEEMIDGFRAAADRRFELALDTAGSLVVDPDRLAQALRNLIRNAIEHTEPGGLVRLAAEATGDRVTIAVEDDGPGIRPQLRSSIFEPFNRGEDRAERGTGVGIGLALVARFAELHGGRAWVQDREGGGASFRVWLPARSPARDDDGVPAPEPQPAGR